MVVKQSHFFIVLALSIVALAFLVKQGTIKLDSRASKKDVRTVVIENCKRGSERAALLAAFMREAGGRNNVALAASIVTTIPGSADESIADVERIENERSHTFSFTLTDKARALQAAGCKAAA